MQHQLTRHAARGPRAVRTLLVVIPVLLFLVAHVGAVGVGEPPPPSLDEAVALYYDGEFEESLAAFRQILVAHPGDRKARWEYVALLREAGKYDQALAQLDSLSRSGTQAESAAAGPSEKQVAELATYISLLAGKPAAVDAASPAGATVYDGPYRLSLWRARREAAAGRTERAREILTRVLEESPFNPLARYQLGLLALGDENYERAADLLSRALREEPSLSVGVFPLFLSERGLGNVKAADARLRQAEALAGWDPRVSQAAAAFRQEHPEIAAARESEQQEQVRVAQAPVVAHVPEKAESLPQVRIGIVEDASSVTLKVSGTFRLEEATGHARQEGSAGTVIRARAESGNIVLTLDGKKLQIGSSPVTLSYADPHYTTLVFEVAYGSNLYAPREDRAYRGTVTLSAAGDDTVTVINTLSLEEYLYSVVPAEMPASWPEQALAAQAIAARSYTLAHLGTYGARGFDLLGSVKSAHYRGVASEHPRALSAVDATRNTVLLSDGKPLVAVYSANSGGYTESSKSVWGFESALVAVPDPQVAARPAPLYPSVLDHWIRTWQESYSAVSPYVSRSAYRWSLWIPRQEIQARVAARYPGRPFGTLERILTRGRGISGRVEEVELVGSEGSLTVTGDAIRAVLGGLRSNLFVIEPEKRTDGEVELFVVTGAGWGHGVGMDQTGAAGMAAAGWDATRILGHYYPGATLGPVPGQ